MLAVYATHAAPDDPLSALEVGQQPEPTVPEGWVRVKVSHASLNRHDVFTLRGISGHPEGITYPIILGNDAAGTLDDGTPVVIYPVMGGEDWRGDETLDPKWHIPSEFIHGTFAEYVVVPRRNAIPLPETLPAVRACRVHPQGNRAGPEPGAGQGRPVPAGEPRDDASGPDLGRPEASRRAFRQGLVRRVRAETRGSHRGVLPHPASAGSRLRSPERCLCRHQRRGQEDRRTPADDARGVHHQAPSGPRLTTKEKNMGKLEGKIAVVTGGSSGIGLATAKQFANEGAYVFIAGRRHPELAAAVKEIGRNVTGVQGDVANLGDLDRLFAQIKREKGKLDIVFANAGVAKFAPLGEITEEHYDSLFDVHVKGLLFTVQKALPLLPDGASIILNASIGASKGPPAASVACATKAAVRSFARTWTTDLKDRRIRVNAVSPGLIDTPAVDNLASTAAGQQLFKMISNSVPLGRRGTADEIAKAVVFLASDDSSYITGTELSVDGGFAQV